MNECKEALLSMAYQFGYQSVKDGRPILWTGGLSALEEAFTALGWEDPHDLPEEGFTCEVKGCVERISGGTPWGGIVDRTSPYLSLCGKHLISSMERDPLPEIKQYALDREAKRDPITRILPIGGANAK